MSDLKEPLSHAATAKGPAVDTSPTVEVVDLVVNAINLLLGNNYYFIQKDECGVTPVQLFGEVGSPPVATDITPFQSQSLPEITFSDYVARVYKYSRCSPNCLLTACIYLYRVAANNYTIARQCAMFSEYSPQESHSPCSVLGRGQFDSPMYHPGMDMARKGSESVGASQLPMIITPLTVHRLFLSALLLAIKSSDDEYYANSFYASIGGLSNRECNDLELLFCKLLNFGLFVRNNDFNSYLQLFCTGCIFGRFPVEEFYVSPEAVADVDLLQPPPFRIPSIPELGGKQQTPSPVTVGMYRCGSGDSVCSWDSVVSNENQHAMMHQPPTQSLFPATLMQPLPCPPGFHPAFVGNSIPLPQHPHSHHFSSGSGSGSGSAYPSMECGVGMVPEQCYPSHRAGTAAVGRVAMPSQSNGMGAYSSVTVQQCYQPPHHVHGVGPLAGPNCGASPYPVTGYASGVAPLHIAAPGSHQGGYIGYQSPAVGLAQVPVPAGVSGSRYFAESPIGHGCHSQGMFSPPEYHPQLYSGPVGGMEF